MLISEIIALAEEQCDEVYTKAEWIKLNNQCQDDLTPVAKMLYTVESIAVSVASKAASIVIANNATLVNAHEIKNVYYLPTAAGAVETQLRRLPVTDRKSKGWKLDPANIKLQGLGTETDGTVAADYYKKLAHCVYVASPESYTPTTPEIPAEYHNLYVLYLCAKSQQREEENEDMATFMAEYNQAKANFALDRIKQMEPWNYQIALAAQSRSQGGA
jgi:hypothetical protein